MTYYMHITDATSSLYFSVLHYLFATSPSKIKLCKGVWYSCIKGKSVHGEIQSVVELGGALVLCKPSMTGNGPTEYYSLGHKLLV